MNQQPVMMFSKHLQGVPVADAARLSKEIGVGAWDLTVRRGGHVDPAQVEVALPHVAEQLAAAGLRIGMITTDIVDARNPDAERVLRATATLGVKHYKLGYFMYGGFGTLRAQRVEVAARLRDLADMNLSLGLTAGFHNHSADFFGANAADIDHVLQNIDLRAVGVYWDPAHATIEGGSGGWRMSLDLVAPRLVMLAVKDFRWVDGKHRYAGARRQSVEFCPLADGNTPWPDVIRELKLIGFQGPTSFHSEYQGQHSFADLTVEQVVRQTSEDVHLFRRWQQG